MKTLKKAWIFLLLVCLAALFSTAALADNATSGTCGDNLTWVLEDGILTINGTGEMEDYSSNFDIPWYSQRTSITSVIIEDGVTTIGDWAFRNCDSLTSMAISNSVTSIGNASFGNCNSLTSVTIPDSVTSIGNSAFAYCETLKNVTIPDSVISIGKQAFLECGIKTITIPGSVTDIGTQAFAYCSQLAEISVSTDNPVYCSADGVLFDKDKTELLCYPAGKESFSCSYEVPEGVTKIGDCSFQACRILEEVILPDGITSIGEIAFNYCSITRMTLPDGVISIGNGAFEACGELTNITIPDSVTFIDDIAFSGCDSLTDVYYGGSETEWNAIYIGSDNDCLIYNATIHYNSTGSGSTDTLATQMMPTTRTR